jgi:hypothetical protein
MICAGSQSIQRTRSLIVKGWPIGDMLLLRRETNAAPGMPDAA